MRKVAIWLVMSILLITIVNAQNTSNTTANDEVTVEVNIKLQDKVFTVSGGNSKVSATCEAGLDTTFPFTFDIADVCHNVTGQANIEQLATNCQTCLGDAKSNLDKAIRSFDARTGDAGLTTQLQKCQKDLIKAENNTWWIWSTIIGCLITFILTRRKYARTTLSQVSAGGIVHKDKRWPFKKR